MHVYESNNIRVSGYPLPLKLKIVDDLTIDNPAYLKAKYQRRPTWGMVNADNPKKYLRPGETLADLNRQVVRKRFNGQIITVPLGLDIHN